MEKHILLLDYATDLSDRDNLDLVKSDAADYGLRAFINEISTEATGHYEVAFIGDLFHLQKYLIEIYLQDEYTTEELESFMKTIEAL